MKIHGRKHAALEHDQEKRGEINVLNGDGMKQDEMNLKKILRF